MPITRTRAVYLQKNYSLFFARLHPLLIVFSLLLMGCRPQTRDISFYYWRTGFKLDSLEQEALRFNKVQQLFTRYFDVDRVPGDTTPRAIAPLKIQKGAVPAAVIPVVYIKNRALLSLTAQELADLAKKIQQLVNSINLSAGINTSEIQFDCDWTDRTKDIYFEFLQQYKQLAKQTVSATIRLHQVKYANRTGIPPVDYGVLMYYNMGEIDAGNSRSIYDKNISARYTPFLKNYPLPLDVALPVFAWGLQLREGKVIKLLNKMNFRHFENEPNFTRTAAGRYVVEHTCFHGGYYFKEKDEIKEEHVSKQDLKDIVTSLNKFASRPVRRVIFYDLDKENLGLYDKHIFKEILGIAD